MKTKLRYIAVLLALVMGMSFAGCNKGKEKDSSEEKNESSVSDQTEPVTESEEKTEASKEETTEAVTETASEDTTAESEPATEDTSVNSEPKGFKSADDVCEAVLTAYLNGDADAVFNCFYPDEAESYKAWINSLLGEMEEDLEGDTMSDLRAYFSKDAVVSMIQKDIDNVHEKMKLVVEDDNAEWKIALGDKTESNTTVDDFKDELGLEVDVVAMYEDFRLECSDMEGEVLGVDFINSPLYFIEINERWYLCYTTSWSNYVDNENIDY